MELKDSPINMNDGDDCAPEYPITLGKKQYTLCFATPAFWKMQELSGVDVLNGDLSKDAYDKMSVSKRMKLVAQLCYSGLATKHPELTFEEVAAKITLKNFPYIDRTVSEAFSAALPERPTAVPEENDADRPLAQRAPN